MAWSHMRWARKTQDVVHIIDMGNNIQLVEHSTARGIDELCHEHVLVGECAEVTMLDGKRCQMCCRTHLAEGRKRSILQEAMIEVAGAPPVYLLEQK